MKYIRKLDLLGPRVNLNINENSSYKSALGGIFTIIISITTILIAGPFATQTLGNSKPAIQMTKKVNPERSVEFNSNTFTLMYAISKTGNMIPIDEVERKFKIFFTMTNINSNFIFNDLNSDLVPCSEVSQDVSGSLIMNLSNYWCIPNNVSFSILNGIGEKNSQIGKIQIEICKNTTKNNNFCYSQDDIYDELQEIRLHYIQSDIYIEGSNYSSPGIITTSSGFITGGANYFVNSVFWYKNIYLQSDARWFFEPSKNYNYFQEDYIEKEVYYKERTEIFFTHSITISRHGDYYSRTYVKLQAQLAYLGGFITIVKFIFSFILEFLIKQDLSIIFDFNFKFDQPKNINNRANIVNISNIVENRSDKSNLKLFTSCKAEEIRKRENKSVIENLSAVNRFNLFGNNNLKKEKSSLNIDEKKISLIKYFFPCFNREICDKEKYEFLIKCNLILTKNFSFEKIAKTFRNVKNLKEMFNDVKVIMLSKIN